MLALLRSDLMRHFATGFVLAAIAIFSFASDAESEAPRATPPALATR